MTVVDHDPLVPVTVIGGYLGAGKTTLINRLLAGGHGRRLAVLVNDFGDINIDLDLIESHDGATIGLTNGCVCCSITDALGDALDQVLALDPNPDQIVVEASGVADPAKVAAYGRGWPGCRLDSVLVLADGETIRARSADRFVGELVVRQLQAADVVVVTKGDLVDPTELEETIRWISALAGSAIVPIHHGGLDPALLLGPPLETAVPASAFPRRQQGPYPGSPAESLFQATTLRFTAPLRRDLLERALASWPDSIVRVKGLAVVRDGDRTEPAVTIVNRVGRRWSIERRPRPGGPEPSLSGRPISVLSIIAIDGSLIGPLHPTRLTADLVGGALGP